ncbi:MAG: GNAT family N-acetyltransferase [Myxococcota bacterium]
MQQKPDIVRSLGYLALGSRFKRLGERLQADAAKAHSRLGYPTTPAHFPLLAALEANDSLTVGEAVQALGVSQPALTRTAQALRDLGMIEAKRDPFDSRIRRMRLSARGASVVERMKRELWPVVREAAAALAEGPPSDLLTLLGRVEDAIAESSLLTRVELASPLPPLRILEYEDRLAPAFASITRAWVEEMFELEANDLAILNDPRATILEPGGEILFVDAPDLGVLGTCALMHAGEGAFELTKMGVKAEARGRKAGAFLLDAVLERARQLKARGRLSSLFLLTNHACGAAIHLYEKHGFVHDEEVMRRYGARYARCDVAMSYPFA